MKTNISFLSILKAEHFKTKRNIGTLILLIFPLVLTIGMDVYIIYNYIRTQEEVAVNPWIILLGRYIFQFYSFFYPLVIAVFCYSLCDMEYRQQNFKQLFTLPVSKLRLFSVKIAFIAETLFLSVMIAYASYMVSGYVFSIFIPNLHFQDFDVRLISLVFFSKIFIATLAIASIQYVISIFFKNFVIPIGFVSFCVIFALIANQWKYIYFVPYHSIYKALNDYFSESTVFLEKVEYINISYISLFVIIAYITFRKIKA